MVATAVIAVDVLALGETLGEIDRVAACDDDGAAVASLEDEPAERPQPAINTAMAMTLSSRDLPTATP
jgi:hypothetical protein